jgi:8-oxo-dGTP diphosphatase
MFHRTPRAAGVLITGPDGRVLMVRDRFRREWSYPAGFVEHGESPLAGAARELAEEVNLRLAPERLELVGTHTLQRPLGRLEFTTFRATVTADEAAGIRLQAIELTEKRWATPAEALELTSPRLKPRLHELLGSF